MALCLAVRVVLAVCLCAFCVAAQDWISVGVKAGIPLSEPFADRTFTIRVPFSPPPFSESTRTSSGSRSFVVGPTIEVQLPLRFSAEADALYRPLNFKIEQTTPLPGGPTVSTRIDTWEFPLLAKYRLPLPIVRPYLAAGPSFRAIGGLPAQHMSGKGVTVSIGAESIVGHFRITPELQYTHWGADGAYKTLYHAVSRQSQIELLAGLAPEPGVSRTPQIFGGWRKYVSVGVKGGLPFTTAFINDRFGKVTVIDPLVRCGTFSITACLGSTTIVEDYSASHSYLVGPMIEVHISDGFSLESDALYAPLSLATNGAAPGLAGLLLPPSNGTFNSWQFPTQAVYRFRGSFVRPYLEAGPTFRSASSPLGSYLSNTGLTAGLGVQSTAWKLHIAPEVRFVHWGHDATGTPLFYASHRNQAQFLIGLSY